MDYPSQWSNLLQNLGRWHGSFTRLSAQGAEIKDTPTLVTLEGLNQNQTVRQIIERFPVNTTEKTPPTVLEYSTLNRSILIFDNGSFSIGSMQFSPVSSFGVELGFTQETRRLRLVPLFNAQSQLHEITLIREFKDKTTVTEKPPLTVEQLLGNWQGEAITLYPDLRQPSTFSTTLTLQRDGNTLHQTLSTPEFSFTSTGQINGTQLLFSQDTTPIQVLLLPDGASCNTPLTLPHRKPFLIEAGWLLSPTERWRMIRQYNQDGTWIALTLVKEYKV